MEDPAVRPSVFMVDGQTGIPFTRLGSGRRSRACSAGQLSLGLLLLLLGTGLALQGWFLVHLHWRLDRVDLLLLTGDTGSREKLIQEWSSHQTNPAAHLTGVNASWTATGGLLLWETQLGVAFLRGLDYRDGALVMSQPGYYYIYSRVQLGGLDCPQGKASNLPITHSLYKRTPRYPEELELLVSRQSLCRQAASPRVWWDSSFLGGVVHLEAGEEVVVRVTEHHLVRLRDGTRSYFGAFMV